MDQRIRLNILTKKVWKKQKIKNLVDTENIDMIDTEIEEIQNEMDSVKF